MADQSDEPEIRFTDATTLRQWFNEERLYERVLVGEVSTLVIEDAAASSRSRQPPGTRSQRVAYFDADRKVAEVDQFLLPDGTVGGSGRPDPKVLLHEGILYIARHGSG